MSVSTTYLQDASADDVCVCVCAYVTFSPSFKDRRQNKRSTLLFVFPLNQMEETDGFTHATSYSRCLHHRVTLVGAAITLFSNARRTRSRSKRLRKRQWSMGCASRPPPLRVKR